MIFANTLVECTSKIIYPILFTDHKYKMKKWTIESLLYHLSNSDYSFEGKKRLKSIKSASSLYNGTSVDLSFCSADGYNGILAISRSNAGVILCKKSMEGQVYPNQKKRSGPCICI